MWYKNFEFEGITCGKCGVEVNLSKLKEYGLASSSSCSYLVFKSLPSRIGLALDITLGIEKVISKAIL